MEIMSKHVVSNFFTDNNDIVVSPMLMNSLISEFSQYEIYPNVSSEMNIATGERKSFIRLCSPDEKIQINMQSLYTNIIVNIDGCKFFNSESEAVLLILSKLGSIFPNKLASRLSYLTCHVYSGGVDNYNSVYKKIFNKKLKDDIYPIEWEVREVFRETVDGELDKINVVSMMKRGAFTTPFMTQPPSNGSVLLETDTNTVFENQINRFSYIKAKELLPVFFEKSEQSVAAMIELL